MAGASRAVLRACLPALAALAACAQYDPLQPLPPGVLLLAKARLAVQDMAKGMPDYTCTQTIERAHRPARSKRFVLVDTLRLEVALVGKQELYSWPGASRFETADLRDLVKGGAISSGDFALHARGIYLSGAARFEYAGEDLLEGRAAHRFRYEVSRRSSGYRVRMEPHAGIVGYRGSVWNDAGNFDLRRIEIEVHEIPPGLPLRGSFSRISYQRVPIGGREFVLPKESELVMTDLAGNESRNRITFSGCRQFSGESTLVFEELPEPGETPAAPVTVTLPQALDVAVRIAAPVDLKKAAVGDLVRMRVSRDARRQGQTLVPRGAAVEGRIVRVWCEPSPYSYCVAMIKPERFSFENKSGEFHAELATPAIEMTLTAPPSTRKMIHDIAGKIGSIPPGTGAIYVRGAGVLSSGYSMVWRTLEGPGERKP
jgi:hypothetical protein